MVASLPHSQSVGLLSHSSISSSHDCCSNYSSSIAASEHGPWASSLLGKEEQTLEQVQPKEFLEAKTEHATDTQNAAKQGYSKTTPSDKSGAKTRVGAATSAFAAPPIIGYQSQVPDLSAGTWIQSGAAAENALQFAAAPSSVWPLYPFPGSKNLRVASPTTGPARSATSSPGTRHQQSRSHGSSRQASPAAGHLRSTSGGSTRHPPAAQDVKSEMRLLTEPVRTPSARFSSPAPQRPSGGGYRASSFPSRQPVPPSWGAGTRALSPAGFASHTLPLRNTLSPTPSIRSAYRRSSSPGRPMPSWGPPPRKDLSTTSTQANKLRTGIAPGACTLASLSPAGKPLSSNSLPSGNRNTWGGQGALAETGVPSQSLLRQEHVNHVWHKWLDTQQALLRGAAGSQNPAGVSKPPTQQQLVKDMTTSMKASTQPSYSQPQQQPWRQPAARPPACDAADISRRRSHSPVTMVQGLLGGLARAGGVMMQCLHRSGSPARFSDRGDGPYVSPGNKASPWHDASPIQTHTLGPILEEHSLQEVVPQPASGAWAGMGKCNLGASGLSSVSKAAVFQSSPFSGADGLGSCNAVTTPVTKQSPLPAGRSVSPGSQRRPPVTSNTQASVSAGLGVSTGRSARLLSKQQQRTGSCDVTKAGVSLKGQPAAASGRRASSPGSTRPAAVEPNAKTKRRGSILKYDVALAPSHDDQVPSAGHSPPAWDEICAVTTVAEASPLTRHSAGAQLSSLVHSDLMPAVPLSPATSRVTSTSGNSQVPQDARCQQGASESSTPLCRRSQTGTSGPSNRTGQPRSQGSLSANAQSIRASLASRLPPSCHLLPFPAIADALPTLQALLGVDTPEQMSQLLSAFEVHMPADCPASTDTAKLSGQQANKTGAAAAAEPLPTKANSHIQGILLLVKDEADVRDQVGKQQPAKLSVQEVSLDALRQLRTFQQVNEQDAAGHVEASKRLEQRPAALVPSVSSIEQSALPANTGKAAQSDKCSSWFLPDLCLDSSIDTMKQSLDRPHQRQDACCGPDVPWQPLPASSLPSNPCDYEQPRTSAAFASRGLVPQLVYEASITCSEQSITSFAEPNVNMDSPRMEVAGWQMQSHDSGQPGKPELASCLRQAALTVAHDHGFPLNPQRIEARTCTTPSPGVRAPSTQSQDSLLPPLMQAAVSLSGNAEMTAAQQGQAVGPSSKDTDSPVNQDQQEEDAQEERTHSRSRGVRGGRHVPQLFLQALSPCHAPRLPSRHTKPTKDDGEWAALLSITPSDDEGASDAVSKAALLPWLMVPPAVRMLTAAQQEAQQLTQAANTIESSLTERGHHLMLSLAAPPEFNAQETAASLRTLDEAHPALAPARPAQQLAAPAETCGVGAWPEAAGVSQLDTLSAVLDQSLADVLAEVAAADQGQAPRSGHTPDAPASDQHQDKTSNGFWCQAACSDANTCHAQQSFSFVPPNPALQSSVNQNPHECIISSAALQTGGSLPATDWQIQAVHAALPTRPMVSSDHRPTPTVRFSHKSFSDTGAAFSETSKHQLNNGVLQQPAGALDNSKAQTEQPVLRWATPNVMSQRAAKGRYSTPPHRSLHSASGPAKVAGLVAQGAAGVLAGLLGAGLVCRVPALSPGRSRPLNSQPQQGICAHGHCPTLTLRESLTEVALEGHTPSKTNKHVRDMELRRRHRQRSSQMQGGF